jgi:hypothetical protein
MSLLGLLFLKATTAQAILILRADLCTRIVVEFDLGAPAAFERDSTFKVVTTAFAL